MNRRLHSVKLLALIAFAWSLSGPLLHADTGLGRHKTLYAVPAPGKIAVDGNLADWDLSAQITMYVTSETAEMQSARFAVMYDADALYLSGVVRDPSPLMNRHDPAVDGNKGWDADACQFRLSVNPSLGYPIKIGFDHGAMEDKSVVHLILWQYTDKQEACLQMHTSMKYKSPRREWEPFGVVPSRLFEGKYVKAEDGRGYTFEYRIPWSTLGAKIPLKAGDLVAGTVQLNWGTPDGLKTGGGAAWCYDVMSHPGFPFQETSCWGKIILSAKGHLPKDLIEEGLPPEKPLPLKFAYSLPEDSQATVQIFDRQGVAVRTLVAQANRPKGPNVELWDGTDDAGQPIPQGQYIWRGIYHQPITQKFLFAVHNSGQPPYHTDDNTGSWGGDHGVPTAACAFSDGVLLAWNACEAGFGILRTDFAGKRLWGSKHCATHLAADHRHFYTAGDEGFDKAPGVKVFDLADGRPLNFGNGRPQLTAPPGGNATADQVSGLACRDGSVYVAYAARNIIVRFDAASGDLKETFEVQAPGHLAARPGAKDGPNTGLLAISGKAVVALAGGKPVPLIADHVDDPRGIAVGTDGVIYVANGGKLHNVSVFAADGKYLRSIGKSGGRPAVGAYDKTGILEPGGIAVDVQNRLWVAEQLDSPERYSQWDARTGNFVNEFFGGCDYFGYGWIDPKKPDEIYVHNVLWKIDWNSNSVTPKSTIWRPATPNVMMACSPSGYNGRPRFFTAEGGKQFCWGLASSASILSLREGDVYKPFAAFITISRGNVYYGDKAHFPLMVDDKKYPNGCYFWQDRNNDQTLQEDELTNINALSKKYPKLDFRWFALGFAAIEPDLTAWLRGAYQLKPVRFETDGRPVYDLLEMRETALTSNPEAHGELWLDPDGSSIYTTAGSLAKWSRDGKQLWAYPRMRSWHDCLALPMQAPGRLWGLTNNLGVAGDLTGNSCYFGTYHLLTRDGIYAAMIMRDGRAGGLGPDVTASETLTGQIVKPDGMNRYFLIAGASDARVTELFGLDTIKRLRGGDFVISEADFKLAGKTQADYAAELAKGRHLSLARGRAALESAGAISRAYESTRSFAVRAAYDDKNLYVSYDVTSPNELVNAIADPRLLFKGGNCLDIQLAADAQADPKRKTPAPGDVRVLVTRQQGKTAAVLFRPKLKDFGGEPIVLTSPTGKESFDAIELTDRITLEYAKQPTGFRATATIPLDLIGLKLKPGDDVKMDVGYLFGNAPGTQVAARAYWVNNSFSANVTADVPNESRLEPAEWGSAHVE